MALVSLDTCRLPIGRDGVLEREQLEGNVQHDPIKAHSQQIRNYAFKLNQSKREVVFVVTKYPVVILISIVLEEHSIY